MIIKQKEDNKNQEDGINVTIMVLVDEGGCNNGGNDGIQESIKIKICGSHTHTHTHTHTHSIIHT